MDFSQRSAIPLSPRSPRTDSERPTRPARAEELLVFELPSLESGAQRRVPVPPYFTHAVLKPSDIDLFSPRPGFLGQAARNERKTIDGVTKSGSELAANATKLPHATMGLISAPPHHDTPPLPDSSDSFQVHFEPVPITPRITIAHAAPDTNYSHSKYSTTSFAPPARRLVPPTPSRTISDFDSRDEKAWKSPTVIDTEWDREQSSLLVDFEKVDLTPRKFNGLFARICFVGLIQYSFGMLLLWNAC